VTNASSGLPLHLRGAAGEGDDSGRSDRRTFWLCPGSDAGAAGSITIAGLGARDLPVLLATLRARINGRPAGPSPVPAPVLDGVAEGLRAARFGVAVWSAAELDALTIEMLCGLVADLNAKTRFSGLPLPPDDNASGVLQVCGWMSSLPPRIGFARAFAEHDPWRFDARRLVDSGEADCVVWISAYRPTPPPWTRGVPTIALTGDGARFPHRPRVHVLVGRPGVDHDVIEYLPAGGTLAWKAATATRTTIRVSDALNQIAAALSTSVAVPC